MSKKDADVKQEGPASTLHIDAPALAGARPFTSDGAGTEGGRPGAFVSAAQNRDTLKTLKHMLQVLGTAPITPEIIATLAAQVGKSEGGLQVTSLAPAENTSADESQESTSSIQPSSPSVAGAISRRAIYNKPPPIDPRFDGRW